MGMRSGPRHRRRRPASVGMLTAQFQAEPKGSGAGMYGHHQLASHELAPCGCWTTPIRPGSRDPEYYTTRACMSTRLTSALNRPRIRNAGFLGVLAKIQGASGGPVSCRGLARHCCWRLVQANKGAMVMIVQTSAEVKSGALKALMYVDCGSAPTA
jgi:hypothetical protein